MRTHGSHGTYKVGCRCEPCREAAREAMLKWRSKQPRKPGQRPLYRLHEAGEIGALIRFCARIRSETPPDSAAPHLGPCWLWDKLDVVTGYGRFSVGKNRTQAHRWSHETFIGAIPSGHQIDHLCRIHACVNPDHLEAVTPRENLERSPLTFSGKALRRKEQVA